MSSPPPTAPSGFPTRRWVAACANGGKRSSKPPRHGERTTSGVFGSVARGEDVDSSDIDLLVELDEGVGPLDLIGLERELTELLGVHVDVGPDDSLKPRMRARALREAVPL